MRLILIFSVFLFNLAGFASRNLVAQRIEFPPSLSYWSLSKLVLMEPELQLKLEISPDQIDSIHKMRRSPAINEVLNSKMAESTRLGRPRQHNALERSFVECDEQVRQALAEFISEEQLAVLRKTAITTQYPSCLNVFTDQEILDFCGLEDDERLQLRKEFVQESEKFNIEVKRLRLIGARAILHEFDSAWKEQFVVYAGSELLPDVKVELPEKFLESVPISPLCMSPSAPTRLIGHRELQSAIGLKQEHLVMLEEWNIDFDMKMRSSDARGGISKHQFYREAGRDAFQRICAVLDEQQEIQFVQSLATWEFVNNYAAPFTRREVLEFLGISSEQTGDLMGHVKQENARLERQLSILNNAMFVRLIRNLPDSARVKLSHIFKDVW
jgi:hypothetical protein